MLPANESPKMKVLLVPAEQLYTGPPPPLPQLLEYNCN